MTGVKAHPEPLDRPAPASPREPKSIPLLRLQRMLLATAGEPNARGALQVAALLARRHAAAVSVVSVFQPPIPYPIRPGEESRVERPQRFEMSVQVGRVRKQLATLDDSEVQWPIAAEAGGCARAIVQEAERRRADLVILGLGREVPAERDLGDRALIQVALCAHHPVLAVAPTVTTLPVRVLLAVGRNGELMRLVRMAAAVAAEGAIVHLLHVQEPGETDEEIRDRNHMMAHAAAELQRMGMRAERQLVHGGDAAHALLEYARAGEIELIVGGLHGAGLAARSVVRNAAMHLAAQSPCSVLLVPRTEP